MLAMRRCSFLLFLLSPLSRWTGTRFGEVRVDDLSLTTDDRFFFFLLRGARAAFTEEVVLSLVLDFEGRGSWIATRRTE